MCSIFRLPPGYNIPEELLFNAVHNNAHGYGVLLKENKRIQVISDMPTAPNPEAIYKILKDNDDVERWVHLRNQSRGAIVDTNVQPFCVFNSNKRQVYFMHNGTINYISIPERIKSTLDVPVDTSNNSQDSDSRQFAFGKLQPLLKSLKGANGVADLHEPIICEIIGSLWQHSHGKGVLISSDQDPFFFNQSNWVNIDDKNGGQFLASNDEYFSKLVRGTLFDQREAERKAKEEKEKPKSKLPAPTFAGVKPLTCTPFRNSLGVGKMENLLAEANLYTPEGYMLLTFLDYDEIIELMKTDETGFAVMFMNLCDFLKVETNNRIAVEKKHNAATTRIAELVQQIQKQRKQEDGSVEQERAVG